MKNKGTSTCHACSFQIKDDVGHVQKFQRHLKSSQHSKEKAWYCQKNNCRLRSFKQGGIRTCSENKPYFRSEDLCDHISENEYKKKNEKEINAKIIKSLTCRICQKKFSHRSEKSRHETLEICKYKTFQNLLNLTFETSSQIFKYYLIYPIISSRYHKRHED